MWWPFGVWNNYNISNNNNNNNNNNHLVTIWWFRVILGDWNSQIRQIGFSREVWWQRGAVPKPWRLGRLRARTARGPVASQFWLFQGQVCGLMHCEHVMIIYTYTYNSNKNINNYKIIYMDSRPYSNESYDECISLQHPWITCDEYTTIPKAATNGLFNGTYHDEHMMKNHRQMEPDDDERVMNWTWQWLSGTYDGPQIGWGKPLGQALGQAQSDRLSCLCWYWPSHIYVHACIYI